MDAVHSAAGILSCYAVRRVASKRPPFAVDKLRNIFGRCCGFEVVGNKLPTLRPLKRQFRSENPALKLIEGEAEPFHVVFGGIKSSSGKVVPDLGVFVMASDYISLDYKMGKQWNTEAVIGLFEIMLVFESFGKTQLLATKAIFLSKIMN